jgi:thioredoxin 1
MSKLIDLTDATFDNVVLKSEVPVAVDFYGDHCPSCRALRPVLEVLADDVGETAVIAKVDVTVNEGLSVKFGIHAVPTILVFKQGLEVRRMIGLREVASLRGALGV